MKNTNIETKTVKTSDLKEEFGSYFRVAFDFKAPFYVFYVQEELGKSHENLSLTDEALGASGEAAEKIRQEKRKDYDRVEDAIEQAKFLSKQTIDKSLADLLEQKRSFYNKIVLFKMQMNLIKDDKIKARVEKKLNEISELEKVQNEPIKIEVKYLPETYEMFAHYPEVGQKIYCVNLPAILTKPFDETFVKSRHIYCLFSDTPTISVSLEPGYYNYNMTEQDLFSFDGTKFNNNKNIVMFTDKEAALSFLQEVQQKFQDNVKTIMAEQQPTRKPKM